MVLDFAGDHIAMGKDNNGKTLSTITKIRTIHFVIILGSSHKRVQ